MPFDWLKLGLLVLQLANKLVDWGLSQRNFAAGEEAQLLRDTQEIMRKSEVGRAVLTRIESLNDAQLDDELRKLEPDSK